MNSTIEQKVRDLLSEVKDDMDFSGMSIDKPFSDAGLDSLDSMSLLFAIQDIFGIEIPDEDVDKLVTISIIVDYVENLKAS